MDDDVDAAQALVCRVDHCCEACGGSYVRTDE
jgi:hypothetical protein